MVKRTPILVSGKDPSSWKQDNLPQHWTSNRRGHQIPTLLDYAAHRKAKYAPVRFRENDSHLFRSEAFFLPASAGSGGPSRWLYRPIHIRICL